MTAKISLRVKTVLFKNFILLINTFTPASCGSNRSIGGASKIGNLFFDVRFLAGGLKVFFKAPPMSIVSASP